jgi:hypothetical protein
VAEAVPDRGQGPLHGRADVPGVDVLGGRGSGGQGLRRPSEGEGEPTHDFLHSRWNQGSSADDSRRGDCSASTQGLHNGRLNPAPFVSVG